jgi:hypothetical protein
MILVMPLDKTWHFVFRFALAGFLIATFAAFCISFQAPNVITNVMILVSPGIWLFLPITYSRVGFANNAVALWFSFGLVAIANGTLYAMVGAAIAGLRWMLKSRGTAR